MAFQPHKHIRPFLNVQKAPNLQPEALLLNKSILISLNHSIKLQVLYQQPNNIKNNIENKVTINYTRAEVTIFRDDYHVERNIVEWWDNTRRRNDSCSEFYMAALVVLGK